MGRLLGSLLLLAASCAVYFTSYIDFENYHNKFTLLYSGNSRQGQGVPYAYESHDFFLSGSGMFSTDARFHQHRKKELMRGTNEADKTLLNSKLDRVASKLRNVQAEKVTVHQNSRPTKTSTLESHPQEVLPSDAAPPRSTKDSMVTHARQDHPSARTRHSNPDAQSPKPSEEVTAIEGLGARMDHLAAAVREMQEEMRGMRQHAATSIPQGPKGHSAPSIPTSRHPHPTAPSEPTAAARLAPRTTKQKTAPAASVLLAAHAVSAPGADAERAAAERDEKLADQLARAILYFTHQDDAPPPQPPPPSASNRQPPAAKTPAPNPAAVAPQPQPAAAPQPPPPAAAAPQRPPPAAAASAEQEPGKAGRAATPPDGGRPDGRRAPVLRQPYRRPHHWLTGRPDPKQGFLEGKGVLVSAWPGVNRYPQRHRWGYDGVDRFNASRLPPRFTYRTAQHPAWAANNHAMRSQPDYYDPEGPANTRLVLGRVPPFFGDRWTGQRRRAESEWAALDFSASGRRRRARSADDISADGSPMRRDRWGSWAAGSHKNRELLYGRGFGATRRERDWNPRWRAGKRGYARPWRRGGWNPHAARNSTRPWLAHLGVAVGGVDDPIIRGPKQPGPNRPVGPAEEAQLNFNGTGPVPDPYADDVEEGDPWSPWGDVTVNVTEHAAAFRGMAGVPVAVGGSDDCCCCMPKGTLDPGTLAWAASGPPQPVPPPLLVTSLVPAVTDSDSGKLRQLGVNVGSAEPAPWEDYRSE